MNDNLSHAHTFYTLAASPAMLGWQGWDPHNNGGEEGTFGANFKHIEWNSPLVDDDHFLNVVPGSHIRRSTPEERSVCLSGLMGDVDREMPGGITVRVNPGDVV